MTILHRLRLTKQHVLFEMYWAQATLAGDQHALGVVVYEWLGRDGA